jgi:hypothetical protein
VNRNFGSAQPPPWGLTRDRELPLCLHKEESSPDRKLLKSMGISTFFMWHVMHNKLAQRDGKASRDHWVFCKGPTLEFLPAQRTTSPFLPSTSPSTSFGRM